MHAGRRGGLAGAVVLGAASAACAIGLARYGAAGVAAAVGVNSVLAVVLAFLTHARVVRPLESRLSVVAAEQSRTAEVNARLASALAQAAEAVMMTTVDGSIIYVNPAFERITGFSAAEAVGRTPSILASGRQDQGLYQDLWQTVLRGDVWRAEITNRRQDGTLFTWEEAITPLRDERGRLTHFIAVGQDVSVQRQLQAQLLQAQKMEAIGRLAGGVAHDFNNLLTVITGYSEQLMARLEVRDPLRRKAEAIRGAADRAAALTQQLLAFSRRQMQKPRILDLNETVAGLDRLLRRMIGEDIELVTRLNASPARVKADPLHLEQVMMNLAVNGRDAMPHGGTLVLETASLTIDAAASEEHHQMPPGDYVLLEVRDTGCGMDAETQRRLFEPFFTTKEQGKGTGLGLSTVYGIVKQNGGHIWVSSRVGEGSAFRIYLPLAAEAVETRSLPAVIPQVPRGTETLLIVEDDADVRRVIKDELQQFGYTVLDASNGGEALMFCERYSGPIHVLITDVVMPHMDGFQVAERLKAVRPGMKTLFVSGYSEHRAGVRRGHGPGEAFLAKPFTPEALARCVREVLSFSAAA